MESINTEMRSKVISVLPVFLWLISIPFLINGQVFLIYIFCSLGSLIGFYSCSKTSWKEKLAIYGLIVNISTVVGLSAVLSLMKLSGL